MSHQAVSSFRSSFRPAVLTLLIALGVTPVAWANVAAVRHDAAAIAGPGVARSTNLEVEGETLSFDCFDEHDAPVCSFDARYSIRNPGTAREEAAVAFYGFGLRNVVTRVDGAVASGTPSDEEIRALDAALGHAETGLRSGGNSASMQRPGEKPERIGFMIAAGPGTRHEIWVTGQLLPEPVVRPHGYAWDAVEARHLLFTPSRSPAASYMEYLLSPILTWQGHPKIDVRIAYPSGWALHAATRRSALWLPGTSREPGWSEHREGSKTVLTRSVTAQEAPALVLSVDQPVPTFRPGGILLGIGGTVGTNGGVRGRIGYEFAAPGWLLYSATLDTNFHDRFIVTPLVEVASPQLIIIPSLGLGLGVPMQVAPSFRPGVRVQGDLHFAPLGFVTSVDIYPVKGDSPGYTQVSLLFQVSL